MLVYNNCTVIVLHKDETKDRKDIAKWAKKMAYLVQRIDGCLFFVIAHESVKEDFRKHFPDVYDEVLGTKVGNSFINKAAFVKRNST